MKTLANGLTVTQSDIKEFIALKNENFKTVLQIIEHRLKQEEQDRSYDKTQPLLAESDRMEKDPRRDQDICFFFTPLESSAFDLEGNLQYNRKSVSIFGNEMDLFKTYSDYDRNEQELYLGCMSGQYDNILYPNDNDSLFGIGYNETCGCWEEHLSIPDGFGIPDNTFVTVSAHFKMDRDIDSNVFKLFPGNTGVRLSDLVGVMGTTQIKVFYTDPITRENKHVIATKTFLNKAQSSDTPVFGDYQDTSTLSVTIPITRDAFFEFPSISIVANVYIAAYTGKNFKPGEVLQTSRQFSLIDFRRLNSLTPEITPDNRKHGAGGIRLQWFRLCFPEAEER